MSITFHNDRKACLLAAMKDQKSRCFWCHGPIVIVAALDHSLTFLSVDHYRVSFLTNGGVTTLGIASADHVIPQFVGGQTDRNNIVAACRACNEDRGQLHNRSWFILDATGFEDWLIRARRERTRKALKVASTKRLTMSLRPALEAALSGVTVTPLKRKN